MRLALGIDAHAVADRLARAVLGNLRVELAIDQQHRPRLRAELRSLADRGVEILRRGYLPLPVAAEEPPIGLHVDIAWPVIAVEHLEPFAVLDVLAPRSEGRRGGKEGVRT